MSQAGRLSIPFFFLLLLSFPQLRGEEWHFTDTIRYPRYMHTATLLQDGRVLVTGGSLSGVPADSANKYRPPCELYDPRSGRWSEAGYLDGPRWGHTATLLQDGRVLVAGGHSGVSCMIYDPKTNSWSTTGSLNAEYYGGSAIRLRDGRVLMIGNENSFDSALIYTPSTGTWERTTPVATGEYLHSLTLLNDGRAMAITTGYTFVPDGDKVKAEWYNTCRIFDPETETWSDPGWDGSILMSYGAALLGDGRLLVAGGYDVTSDPYYYFFSRKAVLYDPVKNKWAGIDSLLKGEYQTYSYSGPTRYGLGFSAMTQAISLKDGAVLVLGGTDRAFRPDNGTDVGTNYVNAQIYDYRTETWRAAGNLNMERVYCAIVCLNDGRVMAISGIGPSGTTTTCEILSTGFRPMPGNGN